MSLFYAALVNERESRDASRAVHANVHRHRDEEGAGHAPEDRGRERPDYIEMVAALVPAEVLPLHALIISYVVNARPGAGDIGQGDARTEGTLSAMDWISALPQGDVSVLRWSFYGLVVLSVVLYVLPRLIGRRWSRFDWVRVAIGPLAFVAWTMLQPFSALDALQLQITPLGRTVAALFMAVVLAGIANAMSKRR